MTPELFDHAPDGTPVRCWRLSAGGLEATILDWGATTVQDLHLDGQRLVLGADTLAPYLDPDGLMYAGAIVGRFANRIGNARFTLDGETHHTDPNFLGRHTLHGGHRGTGQRMWTVTDSAPDRLTLSVVLPDGDMGLPGEMQVTATYALLPGAVLAVAIEAQATRATPCSLAHHGYFTLDDSGSILRHRLRVAADHMLPVDDQMIPTGEIAPVAGTRFDFRDWREVGTAAGIDHNMCLSDRRGPMRPVAWVDRPLSGLGLTVETTEPGLQVYDGAHLGGAPRRGGGTLAANAGLALETQGWPDAPNRPEFPDAILRPGQTYRAETLYRLHRPG